MGNNFSDIEGFNAAPRRERPGLRTAVVSTLVGAALVIIWTVSPYVAGVFEVLVP